MKTGNLSVSVSEGSSHPPAPARVTEINTRSLYLCEQGVKLQALVYDSAGKRGSECAGSKL